MNISTISRFALIIHLKIRKLMNWFAVSINIKNTNFLDDLGHNYVRIRTILQRRWSVAIRSILVKYFNACYQKLCLLNWYRDKMGQILKTAFFNSLSWMKIVWYLCAHIYFCVKICSVVFECPKCVDQMRWKCICSTLFLYQNLWNWLMHLMTGWNIIHPIPYLIFNLFRSL